MIAVAYQLNGAVTVAELLGSTVLFRACTRVLARARGIEEEGDPVPVDPEQELMNELAAGSSWLA